MTTAIGLIGTENSHTEHFIRFLNKEHRHPGFRATALADGANERNAYLAEFGGIDEIVGEASELIGRVDAAIISTRDGARHREQAAPLIDAGIPVLVDKPLAASLNDADALLARAEAAGTLLFSASALRSVATTARFAERARLVGGLTHLHVAGAGDPQSPYSGLFFYGIHHIEAALEILGRPDIAEEKLDVVVKRQGEAVVATLDLAGTLTTFTFVAPRSTGQIPFHITAIDPEAVTSERVMLPSDYNAPTLARFVEALGSGVAPLSAAEMRAPIAVMEAISRAL